MTTKIQKWGNSLAVRLPKKLTTRLGLSEGSEVTVDEREQNVFIRRMVLRKSAVGKRGWKQFAIPTHKKKKNVSGKIDEILYGKSH